MAIKDLLALADNALHAVWSKPAEKPYDPTKDRAKIIKGIEKTKSDYESATPTKGKKWIVMRNGVAKITLPFAIAENGSEFLIPAERVPDFLATLKKEVEAGSLDQDIKAGKPATGTTTARKPRAASSGGTGWSPERKAKFQATIAARNANK